MVLRVYRRIANPPFFFSIFLCLAILGCSTSLLSLSVYAPSASSMYTVRWERNGSKCYDGRTQDIPIDSVVEKESEVKVGDSVRVEWGHGGRLWNATVVSKQPTPSPLELALPAKRSRSEVPPCKSRGLLQ